MVASAAQNSRRRELEEGFNGIIKRQRAQIFSVTAQDWLGAKAVHLAPRSLVIERTNLKHLNPYFGKRLLCEITTDEIASYQARRLAERAAPKTINLEVGTLRAILRKNRLWANLQPDVKMLRVNEKVGRCITGEEETRLLEACRASRSRSLYPAVVLALNTCMRYSELRLLRWEQVEPSLASLTVGKSKTDCGTGRTIPLNERAQAVLSFWESLFPERIPSDFVFPTERYGAGGNNFRACVYETNPEKPIGRWKEAWEAAKLRAGVTCRFHDLRHTGCTRMLEGGVPFSVVAEIMGWSTSTMIRMAKRYGHIGQIARFRAVRVLDGGTFGDSEVQKRSQSQTLLPSAAVN